MEVVMVKFRAVAIAMLAGLLLVACDNWQRTDVKEVQATVVRKYSRRPGKVSRRYYVVIKYGEMEARIRDRSGYRLKKIGDPYSACLITYVEQKSKKIRTNLGYCPAK